MDDMSANEIHIEIPEGAKVFMTYSLLEVVDGEPQMVTREHPVNQVDLTKIRIVTDNGV